MKIERVYNKNEPEYEELFKNSKNINYTDIYNLEIKNGIKIKVILNL